MHCHTVLVFQYYSFKEISSLQFHVICSRQSIRPSHPSNPDSQKGHACYVICTFQAHYHLSTGILILRKMEIWMAVYKWPSKSVFKKSLMSSCTFWVISHRSVINLDIFINFSIVVNLFIWACEKILYPSNNGLLFSFTRISHRLALLFKIK